MKFSTPFRQRVEKDVVRRISKNLKGQGVILVSQGQEVIPSDILGTFEMSSGFRIINLAHLLEVTPDQASKYLKKSLGQKIYKGELLAYKRGWLLAREKIVTSPTDGILDFLNPKTGELRLTFLPKKVDLPAGVYGIVEKTDALHGQIIIKTLVNIIYGRFGSGRMRDGELRMILRRDELVGKSFITADLEGQILVGGGLVYKEAIAAAISCGVSGIISGGINAKDYKSMSAGRLIFPKMLQNDIGISIIVCEGFGSIPIGEDIYQLLKDYDGKFVSVLGNTGVINLPSFSSSSLSKVRRVQLPPIDENLTDDNPPAQGVVDLKVGDLVRVVGNSYPGQQGQVKALDQTETVLPSQVKALMATVETRARQIKVPVANLEVIGYSL